MSNIICGLHNRGNTCFLNTCIQLLINVDELSHYIISNDYLVDLNNNFKEKKLKKTKDINITYYYAELVKEMLNSKQKVIDPSHFHQHVQKIDDTFSGFGQQDTQEIMILLLDLLNDGVSYEIEMNYKGVIENEHDKIMVESIKYFKKTLHNKYSIVIDLFHGMFVNMVFHKKNNKVLSKTFECFNMLTLSLHGESIYDMLDHFFVNENLEEPYIDDKTKRKYEASRQIKLINAPKYLIIVVKKYNDNYRKINQTIEIPINDLNMTKYCLGYDSFECIYDLVSVGCHVGNLNFGHYYSIVLKDKQWMEINDGSISEIDLSKQKNTIENNGYIYVYKKKT